jgi:hypothetical protein
VSGGRSLKSSFHNSAFSLIPVGFVSDSSDKEAAVNCPLPIPSTGIFSLSFDIFAECTISRLYFELSKDAAAGFKKKIYISIPE